MKRPQITSRHLEGIEREFAERSLYEFVKLMWHAVEPETPFVDGWVIYAICKHLQAVSEGRIKRLLINVPPGFSKPVADDMPVQTPRGAKALASIEVGDQVLTHRGKWKSVLAVHEQGDLPVLQLITRCGMKLEAAADHPVLTSMGWVAIGKIKSGDIVGVLVARSRNGEITYEIHPRIVYRIRDAGIKSCRCLTVEDDCSFVAGYRSRNSGAAYGIVVHNSLCTDVFFPSWEWGPRRMPHLRYVCASYSSALTERDNTRMQQVSLSQKYRSFWGDAFEARPNVVKFSNNKTGWKLATSVGGIGTGERGDRVIIDDPNNVKDTESKTVREGTNQWLREVMPTRLNSPNNSAVICIQQRTHEEDASGTLLGGMRQWTHLCIPMRYDPERHCTTYTDDGRPFWADPRREVGELAWPERFPLNEVILLEGDLGEYATAGQFQQIPAPRGGGIIKRDWWQPYGPEDPIAERFRFPPFSYVIASLDTAYTDKEENDPSALVVLGIWTHPDTGYQHVMLIYAWQDRLALNDLVHRVAHTCDKYRVDKLLIEDKASGHSIQQELARLFARAEWGVQFTDPTRMGEKWARAHSLTHLFEERMVYHPNTDWAFMVIDQMSLFPRGAHDDLVDAMVAGLRYLRNVGLLSRRAEIRERERDLSQYRGRGERKALYAV